ncbi:hypothetical protein DIPPA_22896 [Diplonema papillatum]|nr:hypothetical protein DIPPA_22896 [Diplonema papillatum]
MSELKLPAYFPLSVKQCHPVSEKFFTCFTANGVMRDDFDKEAGRRGLQECRGELEAYKKCMDPNVHKSKFWV